MKKVKKEKNVKWKSEKVKKRKKNLRVEKQKSGKVKK